MKTKKIIIVIIAIALLLIAAGTVYSVYVKEPAKPEEEEKNNKLEGNEAEGYKVAELESITTPDKKIRFGSTSVYQRNGVSGMMINVIPYEDFPKVYLKMTMKMTKEKEVVVVYLENLKAKEQIEHEVQSAKDWSKLKSWSIEIITEDEAQKIKKSY